MIRVLCIFIVVLISLWGSISDKPDDYPRIALAFLAACLVVLAAGRIALLPRVKAWLDVGLGMRETLPAPPVRRRAHYGWLLAGLALVSLGLLTLEVRQTYFFTQDDNFALGLPLILDAFRNMQHGIFPAWNPYLYLGLPIASNPQSVFFYPPLFLAYLFADKVLQQPYATLEIFVIFHILAGFAALYLLSRELKLRPALAMLAGLTCLLSGYTLMLGRSWGNVPGYILYFILLLWLLLRLRRAPVGWRWTIAGALVIGLSWYLGNPQYWLLNLQMAALALLLLVVTRQIPWRRACWVLPALALGLACFAPLLPAQLAETANMIKGRTEQFGEGIEQGVRNLLVPAPLATVSRDPDTVSFREYGPIGWISTNYQYMGQLYYSGTLFYAVALLVLLLSVNYAWTRPVLARNPWLACALVTGLLALGAHAVLWWITPNGSWFHKFRGPFKFLGYLNIFVALGAGVVLERWLRNLRAPGAVQTGLVVAVVALLGYHCWLPLPSFHNYGDRPYPPLPASLREIAIADRTPLPQRIYTLAPDRSIAAGYAAALPHNLASLYGIYTCNGYEPLTETTPESRFARQLEDTRLPTALRRYGVRWVLVSLTDAPYRALDDYLRDIGLRRRAVNGTLAVWECPDPDPMAFVADQPARPLPVEIRADGLTVILPPAAAPRPLVVNYLCRPGMRAWVDGQEIPVHKDPWQRVACTLPAGANRLTVRYAAPWHRGGPLAALWLLLAVVSWWVVARLNRKETAAGSGNSEKETATAGA